MSLNLVFKKDPLCKLHADLKPNTLSDQQIMLSDNSNVLAEDYWQT